VFAEMGANRYVVGKVRRGKQGWKPGERACSAGKCSTSGGRVRRTTHVNARRGFWGELVLTAHHGSLAGFLYYGIAHKASDPFMGDACIVLDSAPRKMLGEHHVR
jgi:hypothetical protein